MPPKLSASSSIQWGNGDRVVVFLHYFGGAAESWCWVAEQLTQQLTDCRCIALNLPGFGGTAAPKHLSLQHYADAVSTELTQLGVNKYVLIGHSMGGKVALQVTVSSSTPPQHVVLVAPSPPTQEPMPEAEKQRLLDNHPSRENAETTLSNATQKALTDEQRELAIQTHMNIEDGPWRWWLREGMNHSIADQMAQISVPVTVLASKDDPVIDYGLIQSDVLDVIPGAKAVAIAGVGHLIPLEAPNWVIAQLCQIVQSL
ncbi:MAG: alpha/beta fold hydrolase [Elainellaceae cyanobacterium]